MKGICSILGLLFFLSCYPPRKQKDISIALQDSIGKYDSLQVVEYLEELKRIEDSIEGMKEADTLFDPNQTPINPLAN